MDGILEKIDNEWLVKWSDLHSFAHGTHWCWSPLQSPEKIDELKLKHGDIVQFEFIEHDNFTLSADLTMKNDK